MKKISYFLMILFSLAGLSCLVYPSLTLATTQTEQQQLNANQLAQKVFDSYKPKIDKMIENKKITLNNKNGFFKSLEKNARIVSSKYSEEVLEQAKNIFIEKVKNYINVILENNTQDLDSSNEKNTSSKLINKNIEKSSLSSTIGVIFDNLPMPNDVVYDDFVYFKQIGDDVTIGNRTENAMISYEIPRPGKNITYAGGGIRSNEQEKSIKIKYLSFRHKNQSLQVKYKYLVNKTNTWSATKTLTFLIK